MSKNKKIKALKKQLKASENIQRTMYNLYIDAMNDAVEAVQKEDMTVKIVARILKEMESLG